MGTLQQLRKNLLEMSQEEMLEKIRYIRKDRKINRNPVKQKAAKKEKGKLAGKLKAMLAKMTPAQQEAFLAELSDE